MNYWILKTEPETYSFENLQKDKKTRWDGVRNYQARNNLRLMKVGDIAVIYHSNDPRAAVGIAEIVKPAYKDPGSDEDWSVVDIAPVKALSNPVTLDQMKTDKVLAQMSLVKQSRLSVCPLTAEQYKRLCELAN